MGQEAWTDRNPLFLVAKRKTGHSAGRLAGTRIARTSSQSRKKAGLQRNIRWKSSLHLARNAQARPNVYDLTLREKLFHGVRALRLNPVDESKMFGRDGILAHTFMLGSNGQSNGCVSFSNYSAFLTAYLNGEVTRLVVVDHLANAPGPQPAPQWFADTIKDLLGRS
jgi:Protein of unknown function (DUF2778)